MFYELVRKTQVSVVGTLRIVFTERDMGRVRVADVPDPFWEITNSLDRLQTTEGRREFTTWHRDTLETLGKAGFRTTVARFLIPLLPRAAYFPDFLTPTEGWESFEAGLDAILRVSHDRVILEVETLARLHKTPSWARRWPTTACVKNSLRPCASTTT